MKLARIRDAQIFSLNPPAIEGLGQSSGFDFQLQALSNIDREKLKSLRDILLDNVNQDPIFSAVRLGSMEDTPQLHVNIDEAKAMALGLFLTDIDSMLNYAWAGAYVNDFVDRGRIKKVYLQGDAPFSLQARRFRSVVCEK